LIFTHTGCRPAPENIVPARAFSTQKLDRWRVRYVARTKSSRYLERGLVSILHRGSDIRGFALARVWVPTAKARLGDAILTSFKL